MKGKKKTTDAQPGKPADQQNQPASNGAPAKPTGQAQPQNAKADEKPTFAELDKMEPAALFERGKEIVKSNTAVNKAKEKFTQSLQFFAKIVAAMKRKYTERLNARDIPGDTSFKKYFDQNVGGTLPGRVEAIATLFNALVLTLDGNGKPLLCEEFFDAAKPDWLEKANAIISAAQKEFGENWRGCDAVLDRINALSKPGDAAKKLKEIRERQKGKGNAAGDGEGEGEEGENAGAAAVSLTVGRAVEFLKAAIQDAAKMPENAAHSLFCDICDLADGWDTSGISDETLNEWARQRADGVAPHLQVVKSEPAEIAA